MTKKEAGPLRMLAAIALGSLTVIAIAVVVEAAILLAWAALGADQQVGEGIAWLSGVLLVAWLCPVFYSSRAAGVIYGFWMRHVAGLEW